MLNALRTRLMFHFKAVCKSLNWFKTRMQSSIMAIVMIALVVTLPSLFWIFSKNFQQIIHDWQSGVHYVVYLDSQAPDDEQSVLDHIRGLKQVEKAILRSPADALAELQSQHDLQDVMQYLPENPLPAVVDVIPVANFSSVAQFEGLMRQLQECPHVEQVQIDMQSVNRFYILRNISTDFANIAMILLSFLAIIIIKNIFRNVVHQRQEEIRVLTFLGAKKSYIIRPFLYLSLLYGIVGTVLSLILVYGITNCLAPQITQLAESYQIHFELINLTGLQALLLLLSVMMLSWIGARLSVWSTT